MKVQCIQNVWTAELKRLGSKLKNSNQKVTMPCLQGQKQSKYILEIPFKDIQNMSFSKVFPFQYWPTLVDALRGGSIEENEIPAGCRTEPSIITPNLSSFAVQLPKNYQQTPKKYQSIAMLSSPFVGWLVVPETPFKISVLHSPTLSVSNLMRTQVRIRARVGKSKNFS